MGQEYHITHNLIIIQQDNKTADSKAEQCLITYLSCDNSRRVKNEHKKVN